ncbi:MAG: hypothetical protein IJ666_07385 [Ruminococcus sp.]|nr:hypothetical protein [Ruminococcus sp.]
MRKFTFRLDNGKIFTINPPTVRQYYKGFLKAKNDPELFNAVAEICSNNDENIKITEEFVIDNFTVDDFHRFVKELPEWIADVRNSDPN